MSKFQQLYKIANPARYFQQWANYLPHGIATETDESRCRGLYCIDTPRLMSAQWPR